MKKITTGIIAIIFTVFCTKTAFADPTYAVLDSSGNVTNVIVCGSACEGGTFGGQRVVLQVAADPVTGANRGGVWQGPGTTTYNDVDKSFTMYAPSVSQTVTTDANGNEIISTVQTTQVIKFSYSSTVGQTVLDWGKLMASSGEAPRDNTPATMSVFKNNVLQSLTLSERKTAEEINNEANVQNLNLISENINTLVSMLGAWVK